MKTSNLVAMMVALLISFGGLYGINTLFTQAYTSHEHDSATVAWILPA
jgi:hypothetical protein